MVLVFLRLVLPVILFITQVTLAVAGEPGFDHFFWLEEVQGEHSLRWVEQENNRTRSALETGPLFDSLLQDIEHIVLAKDRVPFSVYNRGYFWNFWQDAANKHGILRRTTLEEYKKQDPSWQTLLDLDVLSAAENENWVYKGSTQLSKTSNRRLLYLSRGGTDAVVIREFDIETKQFITDGFNVPEAKSWVIPIDENTVLVGSDFGHGSLTNSGYARTIKRWHRDQPLAAAQTMFEATPTDMSANATVFHDADKTHIVFLQKTDFFNSEAFLLQADDSTKKIPLPSTATLQDIQGGFIYAQLKEDAVVATRLIPSNSIIRFPVGDSDLVNAEVIFSADPRSSIENIDIRKDRVVVTILDNIKSRVLEIKKTNTTGWQITVLPFPASGIINLALKDDEDSGDITTLTYTDHLTPPTQYLVHDEDGSNGLELIKMAPAKFDTSNLEVIQKFATSKDGTSIPYFLVKRKDLVLNGQNPTILYGYGGFEISLTPSYNGVMGKAWLERGGVYVIANIRGGGEFGPQWHQAALKENRQRAFDDFIGVAEDLIATGVTSPAHLGIKGGSNGGLLVGATMVQRPELFNAALIQVPLLDMLRYSKLLAGASWIGEYGDPDVPEECENLLRYSPYHNVRAGQRYPTPLFVTSTKDDRVHPAHARKMAARMAEQGHSYHYYENTDGGHAGGADLQQTAQTQAREYSYFWTRLR